MSIFKTNIYHKSDTNVYKLYIYYQLMAMKNELVSQNVHKAYLNDMIWYNI